MSRQATTRAPQQTAMPPNLAGGVLQRKCACGTHTIAGGDCDSCQKEQAPLTLQRAAIGVEPVKEVPPIVQDVLRSSGQSLDTETRAFMEQRFGHDFSQVRVHTDEQAAESARAVNALAYTVGRDVVFGTGQYRSGSSTGNRLLAHELTHVMQQARGISSGSAGITIGRADDRHEAEAERVASGIANSMMPLPNSHAGIAPTLQRAPAEDAPVADDAPIDVAIVLDQAPSSLVEARAYAQTVVQISGTISLKRQIEGLGKKIKKAYIVSHSNSIGQVKIVTNFGEDWKNVSEFGKELTDVLPPDTIVDFRGCKLGDAPGELEGFVQSSGVGKAMGYNCWNYIKTETPLNIDGELIKNSSQVTPSLAHRFDEALKKHLKKLTSRGGTSVKDCLIGLEAGEKADNNLDKIKRLYFQKNGELLASWLSPNQNGTWQKGSICMKDVTTSTTPCRRVEATSGGGSAGGGSASPAGAIPYSEAIPYDDPSQL